jgi:hypothetical protein
MTSQARSAQEIEEIICGIWERLLETEVLPHDNFFELGGDSLMVVEVLLAAKQHGLQLKTSSVFTHPTAAGLAAELAVARNGSDRARALPGVRASSALWVSADEIWRSHGSPWAAEAPRCMVPFVTEGSGEPLFVVHWGMLGGFIRETTSAWGAGRPVYSFEAPGFRSGVHPVTTINDLADRYLVEVLERQPHGPYHLAGFCHGAAVAFEMAQKLRARSEEVALLAMVKPATLQPYVSYGWGLDEIMQFRIDSMTSKFGFTGDESLEEIHARLQEEEEKWYDGELGPADLPRLQMLWSACALSLHHYEPRPFQGPVLMVQDVMDREPTERNWLSLMPNAETVWVDYGTESLRPTLRDAAVAKLIRERLVK